MTKAINNQKIQNKARSNKEQTNKQIPPKTTKRKEEYKNSNPR